MPAPTIDAIPVAVRPTRPMLRTNLALAKDGPGPEHPSDAQRKDAPRSPPGSLRRSRWRGRGCASPHARADRLPASVTVRHHADGTHLVAGREDPGLSLERPRDARATALGGEPRRERATPGDRATEPGRRLRGGVACREAPALRRGR